MQLRFSKPWFRKKIEDKVKVLSIREIWSNGKGIPKIGETLYLKDGNRFIKSGMPGCLKPILIDCENARCTGVWSVSIETHGNIVLVRSQFVSEILTRVSIGDFVSCEIDDLSGNYFLNKLAIMDGWNNFSEMYAYFKPRIKKGVFIGNLIYWGKR